jgi:hypothetical protein
MIVSGISGILVGIILIGVALLLLVLWRLPKLQVRRLRYSHLLSPVEQFDKENEARKTITQVLAGAAIVGTLYLGQQQLHEASDQRKLRERTETAERFTKAVEQLGHQSIAVRLGGIYALERIANDFAQDYHWPITEILAGYIRTQAPIDEKTCNSWPPWQDYNHGTRPAADVQAALTILLRRDSKLDPKGLGIDLRYTDLRGAELKPQQQPGAPLRLASLAYAFLDCTRLQHAIIDGVNLNNARIRNADWRGVEVLESTFTGADLTLSNLEKASLSHSSLIGTSLWGTNLTKVQLDTIEFQHNEFGHAILLQTDITGLDLSTAGNLTQAQVNTAQISDSVHLPTGLQQPPIWRSTENKNHTTDPSAK